MRRKEERLTGRVILLVPARIASDVLLVASAVLAAVAAAAEHLLEEVELRAGDGEEGEGEDENE